MRITVGFWVVTARNVHEDGTVARKTGKYYASSGLVRAGRLPMRGDIVLVRSVNGGAHPVKVVRVERMAGTDYEQARRQMRLDPDFEPRRAVLRIVRDSPAKALVRAGVPQRAAERLASLGVVDPASIAELGAAGLMALGVPASDAGAAEDALRPRGEDRRG